ncbi:MAG: antitoxin VapB family protein [Candidatus Woesearchaeota archaeon]
MATTIQVSDRVKQTLDRMKLYERESYNDVIENLIEDHLELNEDTKKQIEEARKRIKSGKFVTQEEIERRLQCSR